LSGFQIFIRLIVRQHFQQQLLFEFDWADTTHFPHRSKEKRSGFEKQVGFHLIPVCPWLGISTRGDNTTIAHWQFNNNKEELTELSTRRNWIDQKHFIPKWFLVVR
jgi:hypothetical protein